MSCHCSRTPYLHDDIIPTILLKLPVKSLFCFSSTCESWYFSINNPKFIKSHIDESYINRQRLLFISSEVTLSPCLQYNTLGFRFYSTEASLSVDSHVSVLEPPLPILRYNVSYPLVSCCNGLLCMVYSHTITLWNPVIRKYRGVPKPDYDKLIRVNSDELDCYESTLYGFAYDSVTEDYKVVAIFVVNAKQSRYAVGIFSVNYGSWRMIDTIPVGFGLFDEKPVSIDGTINMMATSSVEENGRAFEEFAVISMFVVDEVFVVLPLPWKNGRYMKLTNFANRLCLSMFVEIEFFMCYLERLDGEIGWKWSTNIVRVPLSDSLIENRSYLDETICLKENGNIIWRKTDGGFLEYNARRGEVTEFILNGVPQTAVLSTMYVESLASLRIPWD